MFLLHASFLGVRRGVCTQRKRNNRANETRIVDWFLTNSLGLRKSSYNSREKASPNFSGPIAEQPFRGLNGKSVNKSISNPGSEKRGNSNK